MDIDPPLRRVHEQLLASAALGDDSARQAAQMLSVSLVPALRLAIQDVLAQLAADISAEIAPGRIDLALRGSSLDVQVVPPPMPTDPAPEPAGEPEPEGPSTRVTFRPPQQLKDRLEAAASAEGQSLNAYLVRALSQHLDGARSDGDPRRRGAQSWSSTRSGRTSGWFI